MNNTSFILHKNCALLMLLILWLGIGKVANAIENIGSFDLSQVDSSSPQGETEESSSASENEDSDLGSPNETDGGHTVVDHLNDTNVIDEHIEEAVGIPADPKSHLKSEQDAEELGRPPAREGAQSRDTCLESPIALVPGSDEIDFDSEECQTPSTAELGYTTSQQATLWVYVPNYLETELTGRFTLIDNRREVDSWTVPLPEDQGIMCVALPTALEENNTYRWQFQVLLTDRASNNPRVGGLIQFQPDAPDPWYTNLEVASRSETGQSITQWQVLLSQEGLGELTTLPIPSSCLALSE